MLVHFLLDKNENRNALLSKSLSDLEQLREKLKLEYQDWKDKSSRKSIPVSCHLLCVPLCSWLVWRCALLSWF